MTTAFRTIATAAAILLSGNAGFSGDFSWGGFFSNGYIESSHYNYLVDSEEGDADFVEIGVNATWSPFERATINGQLFAFELGPYGNYDPLIDYLFFDYYVNDKLGIRLGRVKHPDGVYTEIQDIDVARTSILLPIGIYDQRYRDFNASLDGISLYGNFRLGKSQSLDYNVYGGRIYLGPEGGVGGFAHTVLSRFLTNTKIAELTSEYNVGLQLWWNTPIDGLRVGTAYSSYTDIYLKATANMPANFPVPYLANAPVVSENWVEVNNAKLSIEYFVGDWTFVAEGLQSETISDEIQTVGGFPGPVDHSVGKGDAWFVSASRRFLEKFEAGATYTAYYGDANNHSGAGRAIPHTAYNKDWQFSLRYNATSNWSLKVEHHSIQGTNRLFNQYDQNPVIDQENWSLFAAKSTFSF